MKPLKAFIKPFELPQRSVKIKIDVNFYFNITFLNYGMGRVTKNLFIVVVLPSRGRSALSAKKNHKVSLKRVTLKIFAKILGIRGLFYVI